MKKNKLDLNKLSKQLDDALNSESSESLFSWIMEQRILDFIDITIKSSDILNKEIENLKKENKNLKKFLYDLGYDYFDNGRFYNHNMLKTVDENNDNHIITIGEYLNDDKVLSKYVLPRRVWDKILNSTIINHIRGWRDRDFELDIKISKVEYSDFYFNSIPDNEFVYFYVDVENETYVRYELEVVSDNLITDFSSAYQYGEYLSEVFHLSQDTWKTIDEYVLNDTKDNNVIYIIEKLWFDSLENTLSNAVGYSMVGYVTDKNTAIEICENSRAYTSKDCWAIMGELQEYKYKKIKKFNK